MFHTADPAVLALARKVAKLGWRVTSILRDGSGSHEAGLALDIAPMLAGRTAFDKALAARWLHVARQTAPHARWAAVSELDHVHLERLAPGQANVVGILHPNHRLEVTTMGDLVNYSEVGDGFADDEYGDGVDDEYGDAVDPDEVGDAMDQSMAEVGDWSVKVRNPFKGVQRAASKLARRASSPFHSRHPQRGKISKKAIARAAMIKRISQPSSVDFTVATGADLTASSLGFNAKVSPAEARPLLTAFWEGLPLEPRVIPFTVVGPNFVLALPDAGFPAGGQWTFSAFQIEIVSSVLNSQIGISFTVTTTTNANVRTETFRKAQGVKEVHIMEINGALRAGTPRLDLSTKIASVDPPTTRVLISGLPVADYSVNARLATPGDATFEGLFGLLT